MKTIHKHKIERDMLDLIAQVVIDTGADPKVIHVAAQKDEDELPTVWIECDPVSPGNPGRDTEGDGELLLIVVPTGHEAPKHTRHVGSAVCRWGQLVWHLYTPDQK